MKKTNKKLFFNVLLFMFVLIFSNSCKKDDTSTSNTVTDIDGNVYHTVTIMTPAGSQTWMVENLRVTRLNDGTTPIPIVTDNTWGGLTTPALCWYNNDVNNKATYGALYNWYSAINNKLCPAGWHVPNDAEWTALTTSQGGGSLAGGKLKESGTVHWDAPNTGADNSSGFTALPAGSRYTNGSFYLKGQYGWYWCTTENSSSEAWHVYLQNSTNAVVRKSGSKGIGFSIRCIKD